MDPLKLNGTETTIGVLLDKANGIFEFSGKSRPENVIGFFEPIFSWIDQYEQNPNQETVFSFKLDYYNSSSAKVLLRLLVRLEDIFEKGYPVKIHWYFRKTDEDMRESGEDYSTLITVPFEFIELN
jgi:hypothetical protein